MKSLLVKSLVAIIPLGMLALANCHPRIGTNVNKDDNAISFGSKGVEIIGPFCIPKFYASQNKSSYPPNANPLN